MYNNLYSNQKKQLVLKIPAAILSSTHLSFNEKLILGLDYTFQSKKGYNLLTNSKIGRLLNLHVNIVSYCRKNLVNKNLLIKERTKYTLTENYKEYKADDQREIFLPLEIYSHKELTTGAKLLWGEYNSISKGRREYFAKRSHTSKRLNASEESITNWTKQLDEQKLLKKYQHRTGYCTSQKVIVTCEFIDGRKVLDITHIQNPQGEWVLRRPKMLGFEEWE
jgi:Mn-dependent DtxR family transcriptional regulator